MRSQWIVEQVLIEVEAIGEFGGVRSEPPAVGRVVVASAEVDEVGFGVGAFGGVAPGAETGIEAG